MDLKSPSTLAVAWLLVPLMVVLASAGLGAGIERVAGLRLGVLTLPAGFMTGIALMTVALELGVGGVTTVVLCATCAVAGALVFLVPRRRRLLSWRPEPESIWPVACGLAAFAIAMAPLIGSGRSGVLGYVLNNDSSVHISATELLRDHGAQVPIDDSSFASVGRLFDTGYPLGSYAWPLFGSVFADIDAFHIWIPLMAVVSAMTALVVLAIVRWLGAPHPVAAVAGTVVASGYLPFSYLAQASAKETGTAFALYATVALFLFGLNGGLRWRALLPAAVGAAAAVDLFGVGALAWLGPAGLVAAIALLVRPADRSTRLKRIGVLAIVAGIALAVALPSAVSSLNFVDTNRSYLIDPNQTGNLIGPVPWSEAFNVWFAYDYRFEVPDREIATNIAVLLAAALALAGFVYTLRRRKFAIPLALFSAVAGSILISRRYSIYFDAKTYMVLAPALGMASVAGLLWLHKVSVRTRFAAIGIGLLLAIGVLVSDGMVYAGAWVTPKDRFQELIDINDRFAGHGPILVNEREDFAKYLLRDVAPWESWGSWQPDRGLRFPVVPAVPRTPDFDDYSETHMSRFRLLLERRRPGGSLPPGNFKPVFETAHYRVWQSAGPAPRKHLSLGGTLSGREKLNCRLPAVEQLLELAARGHERLRFASGGARPIQSYLGTWQHWGGGFRPGPEKHLVAHRGGFAVTTLQLPPGRYAVDAQGSFGPGVRLYADGHEVGEALGDLGLQDGWQRLGFTTVKRSPTLLLLLGLEKPWWQSGSRRDELQGPLAFTPAASNPGIGDVAAGRASGLCGRSLDWIELP